MREVRIISVAVIGAIIGFSTAGLAVEDGLGTNVVRNLRVSGNGTMSLGGVAVTNWDQTGATTTQLANATNDLNTVLQTRIVGATNDLNTAIRTDMTADIAAATNNLNTALQTRIADATNTLDVTIRADMAADIATATNNLNTALQTRIAGATNELNAAIRTDLNLKLDREDGTATNLTVKEALTLDGAGMFTKVATKQSVAANGEEITVANLTFKTIESADAAYTAGIAAGSDGQHIVLQGAADAAFTVTITNNPPAVVLAAGVNFTMNTNDILQLIYNGGWKEVNRVDN